MATSNQINIINISNIPEVQEVFDGNYLIVQTDLGTKIIDWVNFGVLKLDFNSNGSWNGSLTGNDIIINTANIISLSATQYSANGVAGQTTGPSYFNTIQTNGGIVTSASYVLGSPEYVDILQVQIPAATASLLSAYQATYISYNTIGGGWTSIGNGVSASVDFDTLPQGLLTTDLSPADISVAETSGNLPPALSTYPTTYISYSPSNYQKPRITVYIPQSDWVSLGSPQITIKILKNYTF